MANGILVILDKSRGLDEPGCGGTSCAAYFMKRRVGHGGTLDPMATGVSAGVCGPRDTGGGAVLEAADKDLHGGPAPRAL